MKSQSAIEFLTTYAWAFLIVGIFIVSVLAFVSTSGSSSSTYLPTSCFISPSLPCYQSLVFTNTISTQFIVVLQNNLGIQMNFPRNSITVVPSYYQNASYNGGCYPQNALPGATVICNATLTGYTVPIGEQLNPRFTLNYHLCSPKCTSQPYNTTGTAVTVTALYRNVIFQVTMNTIPQTGNIAISGVKYANGANVVFILGLNYPIYAVPPNSFLYFLTWAPSSSILVASNAVQSTTANAIGTGVLTVSFGTTTTSTTTTSSSTTTIPVALGLDGAPVNCHSGSANHCQMTLSTSFNPGDLIIVVTACQSGSGCPLTVAPTDTAGLTYLPRGTAGSSGSSNNAVREDYAIATGILSSDKITCATANSNSRISCAAFAVQGIGNPSAPFDSCTGTPCCTAVGSGSTASCSITTTHGNDYILGISGDGNGNTPSAFSPFTQIVTNGGDSDGAAFAEGEIVSTTQSGLSVAVHISGSSGWEVIGDAIQGS